MIYSAINIILQMIYGVSLLAYSLLLPAPCSSSSCLSSSLTSLCHLLAILASIILILANCNWMVQRPEESARYLHAWLLVTWLQPLLFLLHLALHLATWDILALAETTTR